MQSDGWIRFFQKWLTDNKSRLDQENIRTEILGVTPYVPSSIHVDFFAECHEATVQLWENGLSDFHVADWKAADLDPNYQVKVIHHEFQSEGELFAALDTLARQMSLSQEQEVARR